MNRRRERRISIVCGAVSILGLLIFWQLASMYSARAKFIPSPLEVIPQFFVSFVQPIGIRKMGGHILASMLRVLSGFLLASVVGIVLGIATGRSRICHAILNPFIEILRPIPGIAWIPIAILWFGTGEASKIFILFIATFTILAVNAHAGAANVDAGLIGAARMLGASGLRIFFTIVLPSCVPQIFAGLQTGLSISWMTIVAAEMIRSEYGVGWVITAGNNSYNMTQVMIGLIAIGIIGFLLAGALRLLERRLCGWK